MNPGNPAPRPLARCLTQRFTGIYMTLYMLPYPIDGVLGEFGIELPSAWREIVPWVGQRVFGSEITVFPNGSGDTTYNYVEVLCLAAVALLLTACWSVVSRRSTRHAALSTALRVYTRYYVGLFMLSYGLSKVFLAQFPVPESDRLLDSYGHSSPMGLLWTFMGASKPYQVFAGVAECLGGLLLFFRRTTPLGAVVVIGVMTNVVLLNFCYDVPVKLFSSHLLLFAIWVLGPDFMRLLNVVALNRPSEPRDLGVPLANRCLNRARWCGKSLVVLGVNGSTIWGMFNATQARQLEKQSLFSATLYEVESWVPARGPNSVGGAGFDAWKRLYFTSYNTVSTSTDRGPRDRYKCTVDLDTATISWVDWSTGQERASFAYQQPDAEHLVLDGTVEGCPVRVGLRKSRPPEFLLMSRGFRWINEFPHNR